MKNNIDSAIAFNAVIDHPDTQRAINLLSLDQEVFFVYGGTPRGYMLYALGQSKEFKPNDIDILLRISVDDFENLVKGLVADATLPPIKNNRPPYFKMKENNNFRILYLDESGEEKHIDIKCIGDEPLETVLSHCMLNVDSLAVDQNGILQDPLNVYPDLIKGNLLFNQPIEETIKNNPSNAFRYYAMCDQFQVEPVLGKTVSQIAAPLIKERPFYEFNARLNSVLAKSAGHQTFQKMFNDGLLKDLPFNGISTEMVDRVVFLEKELNLKPQRGIRVLAAFHDSKSITLNQKETTIQNLKARKKWEEATETRPDVLKMLDLKLQEKTNILETTWKIDLNPDLLKRPEKTLWNFMDAKDQLAVLLLSNTVYDAFAKKLGEDPTEQEIKESEMRVEQTFLVNKHLRTIKTTAKGKLLFNAS